MKNKQAKLGILFLGLVLGTGSGLFQSCDNFTNDFTINEDFGQLNFKIDTTEFLEERFFSVNYELVSFQEGYFKIVLQLKQNDISKNDSIYEYVLKGDTLKGTTYYVDAPVSMGLVQIIGRLDFKTDDEYEQIFDIHSW